MVLLMSAFALLLARVIKDYGSTLQHVLLLALPIKARTVTQLPTPPLRRIAALRLRQG